MLDTHISLISITHSLINEEKFCKLAAKELKNNKSNMDENLFPAVMNEEGPCGFHSESIIGCFPSISGAY